MTFLRTRELNIAQHQPIYDEVVAIYDLANNILDTLGAPYANGQPVDQKLYDSRLSYAEPVIAQSEKCADMISGIYITLLQEARQPTSAECLTIEKAIREFFNSIIHYNTRLFKESVSHV